MWISYGDWLAAPRRKDFFTNPRILVREITNGLLFCSYTEEEYYNIPSIINIITNQTEIKIKYLLSVLNSKLIGWYYHSVSPKAKKGLFPKILVNDVRNIPIPKISFECQNPFISKADIMLTKNKELHELKSDFFNFFKSELTPKNTSKKLENWNQLDWQQFKKEMEKCKVKELSLKDRKEWQDYFIEHKEKADKLKSIIDSTDREIDLMVYELYGLTQEEIEIVEGVKQ